MAAKKEKTLADLFEDGLKDIYYAEKKILAALPKMAKATKTDELASAFEKHKTETEHQVERLERVFEMLQHQARGPCLELEHQALRSELERAGQHGGSHGYDEQDQRPPRHGRTAVPFG